jgi:hypothetical protein
MPPIEISWIEGGHHPYIDPNIETLIGYTAHEVRELGNPIAVLALSRTPTLSGLLDGGPPHEVVSKITPLTLQHKKGYSVCCQATLICRYAADGQLVEIWAALRRLPRQCQFNALEEWWANAPSPIRQLLHDSLALFPAPA